ncbi:MAG TPA: erythromycin esterase family protein, partial [Pirellulales bacterium]|nr:erythromycin esterase family protein [Pirellulales bacterium]
MIAHAASDDSNAAIKALRDARFPLANDHDLAPLIDRIGQARYVLLGAASHGTDEYHRWRQRVTQQLVRRKHFNVIAIEGSWSACRQIDQFIAGAMMGGDDRPSVLQRFNRWPAWMWANASVPPSVEWLRNYNGEASADRRVSVYGLDLFELWDSLQAIIEHLDRAKSPALDAARQAYRCFEPFENVAQYARAPAWLPSECEEAIVELLTTLHREALALSDRDDEFHCREYEAAVEHAERYYRELIRGSARSWNVREMHMAETLRRIVEHHGPDAKVVIWEHNSHVGDARATDMARAGMVNLGQLLRMQNAANEVLLVGFASYHGSVLAAREWGSQPECMTMPAAEPDSWEDLMHRIDGRS